ncbi:adenine deaminase C-terminal domain-containing protein [Thermotoga profunda]|uniref:adenine deaminase C-terminal domain-containing protein n=1 Tax=Thermotoga profunda TaxID=1508420 RepID=UPI000597C9A4|nr:adenine deaminase C-terminal domain-containing protein [Thermotoga profunda]
MVKDGVFEFVEEGEITENEPVEIVDLKNMYVVPGLIDAHMHVESSLVTCSGFAEVALKHGTIAVLQDPHEMANVFGIDGVRFMIENGKDQPLKFYTAIPSCVPTTNKNLETPNASIEPEDVEKLAKIENVIALGEVMDYIGVLNDNEKLLEIIEIAKKHNLLIEGHCPTLKGKDLSKYISTGIGSDHTLTNPQKLSEQLSKGMCVMIQEKSLTEENIQAISKLKDKSQILLVTDDTPTTKLLKGHLNKVVSLAAKKGWDLLDAIASATIKPARYLKLPNLGAIAPAKYANFFVTENLEELEPINTFCKGVEYERLLPQKFEGRLTLRFDKKTFSEREFHLSNVGDGIKKLNVVICNDRNSFTELIQESISIKNGFAIGDYVNVAVFHRKSLKGHVGLLKGFGMHKGAFASSFSHDSHNIVVVGKCSRCMKMAVEELLNIGGGMVYHDCSDSVSLPLEIGGIISTQKVETVARRLEKIENALREAGVRHKNPVIFLSVLALTVSPLYKFSDLGIVDTERAKVLANYSS